MMREQAAYHFDPRVLDIFLSKLDPVLELRTQFPDIEREPRIRVVIVDDHQIFINSLSRLLAANERISVVSAAHSVAEGVEAVGAHLPDVVMMDFELPDGDGAKATRMIKALYPDVRIVMLTARTDRQAARRCIAAGCSGFVNKTDAVEELVEAITAAYNGEIPTKFAELKEILNSLEPTRQRLGQDLGAREIQVLNLMAIGMTNRRIADEMFLSLNTVRNHVQNIFLKLDAHSKLEAVATAMQEGILVRNSA
jgi:DNA-binding NarL/FixJ family response regulator